MPFDYAAFVRLLEKAVHRGNVALFAYCVMPNHWHLVLAPKADGARLRLHALVDDDARTAMAGFSRLDGPRGSLSRTIQKRSPSSTIATFCGCADTSSGIRFALLWSAEPRTGSGRACAHIMSERDGWPNGPCRRPLQWIASRQHAADAGGIGRRSVRRCSAGCPSAMKTGSSRSGRLWALPPRRRQGVRASSDSRVSSKNDSRPPYAARNWRAMTSRWISLVPSPMVVSFTSRKNFSAG